jgi:predicted DNA binding CopG/RHH family protein
MKYTQLIDEGASASERQTFLSEGGMTAVTLRIPRNLKDAAAENASLKGMSFSAYVRNCVISDLTKEN